MSCKYPNGYCYYFVYTDLVLCCEGSHIVQIDMKIDRDTHQGLVAIFATLRTRCFGRVFGTRGTTACHLSVTRVS